MEIAPDKLAVCLEVLQQISEAPAVINDNERMKGLIAKIHREGKRKAQQTERERGQTQARRLRGQSAIAAGQHTGKPFADPAEAETEAVVLEKPTVCYICKTRYSELHFCYHMLCPECAAFNYTKRTQRADLTGRTALVTGGRIKIGYQTALRLLRDGAKVLLTTRFPHDAACRFAAEPDFACWQNRLQIYGLDFRNLPAVEAFLAYLLEAEPHLDILINNAAQTLRRPEDFYRALWAQEQTARARLSGSARALVTDFAASAFVLPAGETPTPDALMVIPQNVLPVLFDADGQPLDLRSSNSWSLKLDEVSSVEMLEVQLVNAVAPFLLTGRLKPLLLRSPFARRFVVNVSAMEGQFNRPAKTVFHPHTNMAKAALNMMTRTSAADYAADGIFMNSVDTGWITDENPFPKKRHAQEAHGFYTPLDVLDGMARIYDPIVQGLEPDSEPLYGHFLKDYRLCAW